MKITLNKNIGTNQFYFYIPMGVRQESIALLMDGKPLKYSWEGGFLTTSITGCGEVDLHFSICIVKKGRITPNITLGSVTFWHGVLLLGVKTDKIITVDENALVYTGKGIYVAEEVHLEPINGNIYKERDILKEEQYQIIF